MTTSNFYQHINRNIPLIQSFASTLTDDFDTARFLYLETTHQATKYRTHLQSDTFEEWLMNTMKEIYFNLIQKKQ